MPSAKRAPPIKGSEPFFTKTDHLRTRSEKGSDPGYNERFEKVRVGQTTAAALRGVGGKSGLHRAGRQVTPGGCESMESATENIPPKRFGAGKGEKVR